METAASIKHVDTSRHVRYLWFIRGMDYGLIYVSIQLLLQTAVGMVIQGPDLIQFVMAALAGWFVYVGLRNVGTAASRKWKTYAIALCVALPSCLLIGALGISNESPSGPLAAIYFFFALWIVATLYAVSRVRTLRIPGTDVSLRELGKTMTDDGRRQSNQILMQLEPDAVERVDPRRGDEAGIAIAEVGERRRQARFIKLQAG